MLPENFVRIANRALDDIVLEYKKDHHVLFSDETERRSQQYASVEGSWIPGRGRKDASILVAKIEALGRSHSIQKTGSLGIIAQDGIVLTPEFNQETGLDELVEKGISWASTFPGFCAKHETLFQSFENEGRLSTNEAIALQIYRSFCREIVRLRHNIEHAEQIFVLTRVSGTRSFSKCCGRGSESLGLRKTVPK